MIKEDEMKALADLVDSMHKLAAGLETMAIYLLSDAEEVTAMSVAEPEPTAPKVTLEEVRAVLAEKSAIGHTAEVRQLLKNLGADKLSAVRPEDYATLKAKAEVL